MSQPLGVYRAHEHKEAVERLAFDAVAIRISVERHKRNRHLPAHRAVVTVEPQSIPRLPIKLMPRLFPGLFRSGWQILFLDFQRVFVGQFCKPAIAAFPLKIVAEGRC